MIYLIIPVQTPTWLLPIIDTPLGIALIVAATLATFFFANPLLAVLTIFFAYTLIRRSSANGQVLSQLNRITTQSVMGLPSSNSVLNDNSETAAPIVKTAPPLRKKKAVVEKQTLSANEMTYPMSYEQSMDNIDRVAGVERDLSEGTYTREEQTLLNDQVVVTQPPVSLEEEMVRKNAPIDTTIKPTYVRTQFQPVATNVGSFGAYN
jgi:hypothetical protein